MLVYQRVDYQRPLNMLLFPHYLVRSTKVWMACGGSRIIQVYHIMFTKIDMFQTLKVT